MAAKETGLLAVEMAYYDDDAHELLLTYPNRYLLIHGGSLVGDYERQPEAAAEDVRRYGRGPFLVRLTGYKVFHPTAPAQKLGFM